MVAPLWPPKWTLENPDEILNAGSFGAGALFRLQSSATEGGVYADVAGTGSTPTVLIVTGVRTYTGYDPSATTTTWFRYRVENAAGTKLSDFSTPFQAGGEEAGQLTSLFDVKQRLFGSDADSIGTAEDENILSYIRQVSFKLQNRMGRRFARYPLFGESTFYFDVDRTSRELSVPAGIASMSALEVASSSQPASGGTYTTVATTDWFLRPLIANRDFGWPATSVCISDRAGSYFYPGYNTVKATMALGWATVPDDIAKLAEDLVVEAHRSRGTDGSGPAFTINLDGSRTFQMANDRGLVSHYSVIPVG